MIRKEVFFMEIKQEWRNAIEKRTSRRTYLQQEIPAAAAEKLEDLVKRCNAESGLRIRLVQDGGKLYHSFTSSYGMFKGVQAYFAMVGEKGMPHFLEKVGYYGELLVLESTALGLGTCWVGGTYDRKACEQELGLGSGEELACIVPVGVAPEEKTLKEKTISLAGRGRKPFGEWVTPSEALPDWAAQGVNAAIRAPSAMNRQPVHFAYRDGKVTASVPNPESHQGIDLGIAQAHFEIAAGLAGSGKKWTLSGNDLVYC